MWPAGLQQNHPVLQHGDGCNCLFWVLQVRSDWFVYVVLSCLPWVGKELYEKKDVEMDRLLSQIEGYLK